MPVVYIGGYPIDVAVDENHQLVSTITDNPVEEGADIADHTRNLPARFSLECVVSNSPLDEMRRIREAANGDSVPSVEAWEFLKNLRDSRELFDVSTSLDYYENMLIESLTVPRTAETGDALRFTVGLKQVELVTNDRTTVKVRVPRAKKKAKRGNKPPKREPREIGKVRIVKEIDGPASALRNRARRAARNR